MKRELEVLRVPRAWTLTEAASLLDLHRLKLWRMIQAGELRAFKQTFFYRPPGSPHAFKRERLYVSSAELNRYMSQREAEYAQEIEQRRSAAPGPRATSAR